MPVSGPLITVTRGFDPRHLASLELWLPEFTLPNGPSLTTADIWPGAPALFEHPGSPADGEWSSNPATKAFIINENTTSPGALWDDPWIANHRGLAADDDIHLDLVDTGTSTPHTITLTGPLTLVSVVRNAENSTHAILDDGTIGDDGYLGITSDQLQAATSTSGGIGDIAPDNPPGGELDDPTQVVLVMIVRDASNDWRVWINGVEVVDTPVNQDGTLELRSVMDSASYPAFKIHLSHVLLYSADHSSRVEDLTAYFTGQYGTP